MVAHRITRPATATRRRCAAPGAGRRARRGPRRRGRAARVPDGVGVDVRRPAAAPASPSRTRTCSGRPATCAATAAASGSSPARCPAEGSAGAAATGGMDGAASAAVRPVPRLRDPARCRNPSATAEASADLDELAAAREAQEARHPLGPVLRVGAVQRLQLPPARHEQERAGATAGHRAGADPRAVLEGRAEHREVQRHPVHAQPRRRAASAATISSVSPFRRVAVAGASGPATARGAPRARTTAARPRRRRRRAPRPARTRRRPGRRAGHSAIEKPAFGLGVTPPRRRAATSRPAPPAAIVRVPADPHRVSGALDPVNRLAHRRACRGRRGRTRATSGSPRRRVSSTRSPARWYAVAPASLAPITAGDPGVVRGPPRSQRAIGGVPRARDRRPGRRWPGSRPRPPGR